MTAATYSGSLQWRLLDIDDMKDVLGFTGHAIPWLQVWYSG